MSPLNPAAPPPVLRQRVRTAVKDAAYRHHEEIEIAVCGGVLGVALSLVGISIAFAAFAALIFLAGAFIQAHLKRGK